MSNYYTNIVKCPKCNSSNIYGLYVEQLDNSFVSEFLVLECGSCETTFDDIGGR